MNTHAKLASISTKEISPSEWQARVDLAAVYRLIAHYSWDDVIYNHSSMRVPGEPRHFLMKKHDILYTEVTASNLVKVCMDEDLDEKSGVNRPGFTLHGGVLAARPDVNCAVHIHTNIGMAIAGLKGGLRMVSQQAIRFYQRIGYHAYEGITEDFGEREPFGQTPPGGPPPEPGRHTGGGGGEPIEVPPEVCAKTAAQYESHDAGRGSHDWAAYLRKLDNIDTSLRNYTLTV